MSQINFIRGIYGITLLLLLVGCGKRASDEIDFGTVEGSVFHNNYFGMTVTLPKDWSIQDQAEQKRLMKLGAKVAAGDDKNLQATIKASEQQSVNMFAAFQLPVGSPVPFNPSIICIAEDVRVMPGIQRGKDYHYQVKKMLESSRMQVTFTKDIYTQSLGGTDFDIMDAEMIAGGKTVKQKYYASIVKGYALCFVNSFTTDAEEKSLENIMDTVTFK